MFENLFIFCKRLPDIKSAWAKAWPGICKGALIVSSLLEVTLLFGEIVGKFKFHLFKKLKFKLNGSYLFTAEAYF